MTRTIHKTNRTEWDKNGPMYFSACGRVANYRSECFSWDPDKVTCGSCRRCDDFERRLPPSRDLWAHPGEGKVAYPKFGNR